MSEPEQELAIGKAVLRCRELLTKKAALRMEANRLASDAQRVAEVLKAPKIAGEVTAPDPQKIQNVMQDLRETEVEIESLRETLNRFGLEIIKE